MRFIAATVGILVSLPPLIFFWIGTQTFIRASEKALAVVITAQSGALLLLSAALFFTSSVQRLQGILLVATIATVCLILAASRLFR